MKHRFETCLLGGILAALALVWYSAMHRHAGLIRAAAEAHQAPGELLVVVFFGTAAAVTMAAFIVATIMAARRHNRSRGQGRRPGRAYSPGGRR